MSVGFVAMSRTRLEQGWVFGQRPRIHPPVFLYPVSRNWLALNLSKGWSIPRDQSEVGLPVVALLMSSERRGSTAALSDKNKGPIRGVQHYPVPIDFAPFFIIVTRPR